MSHSKTPPRVTICPRCGRAFVQGIERDTRPSRDHVYCSEGCRYSQLRADRHGDPLTPFRFKPLTIRPLADDGAERPDRP